MRAYYYAVLGAAGGLIGWQMSNVVGLSFVRSLYLGEALVGALIGLCLGLMIGVTEGLVTQMPAVALRSGALAGALGLVAGAAALPLAEWVFEMVGGGAAARAFGWGLFGLLIGAAEGITGRTQGWKGALGGLVGGSLGGVLLEAARRWLSNPVAGKGAGMVLLGASIGALVALIVVLLSRAWLEVASGKLKGTEFILDKFLGSNGPTAILGSDALKADIALPDPDIAPQHALLAGAGSHFVLKDLSASGTFVDGRRVAQVRLSDRQHIRMGNTELVYHEKR
jgi:hypothetical protein